MDIRRTERIADRIIDAFADLRVATGEIIYVAMYLVIKTHGQIEMRDRLLEFCNQVHWEIDRENKQNG